MKTGDNDTITEGDYGTAVVGHGATTTKTRSATALQSVTSAKAGSSLTSRTSCATGAWSQYLRQGA